MFHWAGAKYMHCLPHLLLGEAALPAQLQPVPFHPFLRPGSAKSCNQAAFRSLFLHELRVPSTPRTVCSSQCIPGSPSSPSPPRAVPKGAHRIWHLDEVCTAQV